MKKQLLQDEELDRVGGGMLAMSFTPCPSCHEAYVKEHDYPQGFLFRHEKTGCFSGIAYFKCPGCGYEWKE